MTCYTQSGCSIGRKISFWNSKCNLFSPSPVYLLANWGGGGGHRKKNYLVRLLHCVSNIAGALESLTPERFAKSVLKENSERTNYVVSFWK